MTTEIGRTVAFVDTSAHKVIQTISVPHGESVKPKLYAANSLSNDVMVIDALTRQVLKTVRVGDGPWGIAFGR